jgi:hypothetical protein
LNYWVAVVAKNAAQQLPQTLDSLLNQAQKPERVTIVDDGSTDETPQILSNYRERHESIFNIVTLPDRGYDIRRVPSNINLAWKTTTAFGLKCDFFMISGDDCFYPSNYARSLLDRMEADNRVVVASGRPASSSGPSREHSPSGSGRMVSSSFWNDVGATYPLRAGWETWLLYAASARGLKAQLFGDIVFEHLRPRGTKHQFLYWGAAMQTLGYHPLYALGRITRNLLVHPLALKGPVNMFRGYLQAKLGCGDPFISPFEPSIRAYVRQEQAYRIANIVGSLL